jgi:hypothetical protein
MLGPWPEAPPLATIHPRVRKPSGMAKAAVQLGYALLQERRKRGRFDADEVAICVGSAAGCSLADAEFAEGLEQRGEAFGSPSTFVYTLPTTVLGEIAIALGVHGEITAVSTGISSGVGALAMAAAAVSSGRWPACLCGGMEMATVGARRVFASGGRDSMALFLLEPADERGSATLILDSWRSGFRLDRPPAAPSPFLGNGPLLELAAAVGDGSGLVACAAPEGFWAEVSYHRGL